jgi:hypothetical protein
MEIYSVRHKSANFKIDYYETNELQTIHLKCDKEDFYCALAESETESRYEDCFTRLDAFLLETVLTYDNVIRQWNYIPNIFDKSLNSQSTEYELFNQARFNAYTRGNATEYPAATGIGVEGTKATIVVFAVKRRAGRSKIALSNPLQTEAFHYSGKVLLCDKIDKKPLFSRALAYIDWQKSKSNIFVSGTAAIRGENSEYLGKIQMQTIMTCENIKELASGNNINATLAKKNVKLNCNDSLISYIKVFVKNERDFEAVKAITKKQFPNTPSLYVKADVCREELLVEIEALGEITVE